MPRPDSKSICRNARTARKPFSDNTKVHTVAPGIIFADEDFTVRCLPLVHRIETFGYRVEEQDQSGTFDVAPPR
jgi:ribonuclease Z